MSSFTPEKIARRHQKDLAQLKKSKGLSVFRLLTLGGGAVLIVFALFSSWESSAPTDNPQLSQRGLSRVASHWREEQFIGSQEKYSSWLEAHGTSFEAHWFDVIASGLQDSMSNFLLGGAEPGVFGGVYLSILDGGLRFIFMFLACWRIWIIGIIGAAIYSYHSLKVYKNDDLLGESGNERLFYSGIRVGLDQIDSSGNPLQLYTGLACPKRVSESAAKSSSLAALLSSFGAANQTNLVLVAIILEHRDWPAYVADKDELTNLAAFVESSSLLQETERILETCLKLHSQYAHGDLLGKGIATKRSSHSENILNATEYHLQLKQVLHQVLTPELRHHLGTFSSALIATVVLAYEAGKVMAYAHEGGKWLKKTSFGQLSSRSILHSIPAFAREYSIQERAEARRAIIYGSRQSVAAPVRLPLDLSQKTRAARQWIEVLMACPHELEKAAHEVELIGLIQETQAIWTQAFFDAFNRRDSVLFDKSYASLPGNLFFIPLKNVLHFVQKVIDSSTITRIDSLLTYISQGRQKREALQEQGELESDKITASRWGDRLLPPLSIREIKELSKEHQLSSEDLKAWSSIRVVINSYGWLGRRVGDLTVPESAIIFTVMRKEPSHNPQGELIGHSGMVPFRAARLSQKFGKSWPNVFELVNSAKMAETEDEYERLLRGLPEREQEERELDSTALG